MLCLNRNRACARENSMQANKRSYGRSSVRFVGILFATMLLGGCCSLSTVTSSEVRSAKSVRLSAREACSPSGAPNSKYYNGSECNLFVMTSKFCAYGENGQFLGEQSEPAGVCMCGSTP